MKKIITALENKLLDYCLRLKLLPIANRRFLVLVSAMISCVFDISGQENQQLIEALKNAHSDSLRIELYSQIAKNFTNRNFDSSYYYGYKGLEIAKQYQDSPGYTSLLKTLGTNHFFQSNYDSALYYFNISHSKAAKQKDSLLIGSLLNNIGLVYSYMAKHDTSIHILLKARNMREKTHDPKISSTINNLGNVYYNMDDPDRALPYYMEAAELKEKFGQTRSLSNTLNNIGIILKGQGRLDEAIPYYQRSLEIAKDYNDKNKQANAHNNLASLYSKKKTYTLSEQHYLEAIRLKSEINDQAGLFNTYSNYSILLSDIGELQKALQVLEKAEVLSDHLGHNLYTSSALIMKAKVLFDLGRKDEAFKTQYKGYLTKIEEINQDRNDKIANLEVAYETAKKEAKIEQLALENQLKDANLAKARSGQFAMGIGGGCAILLLVVFFTLRAKKQRAEAEAQELQMEALRKRIIELHSNPGETIIPLEFSEINKRLFNPLTEREYDSLKLSLEGKTNSEIAEQLFISTSTVKFHLRNTYAKLGVANRKEALEYVVNNV